MEFRKMVTITRCTRQQKRHWCIEQSYGLCGRGRGWKDLGEWHWNMYNIMYETSCQSRFDAWYWMLGAGALGRPRGMVWGGRREEGSGWILKRYNRAWLNRPECHLPKAFMLPFSSFLEYTHLVIFIVLLIHVRALLQGKPTTCKYNINWNDQVQTHAYPGFKFSYIIEILVFLKHIVPS